MDLTYICMCGHVDDEHETGFFRPCTIDGCQCDDYEADPDADQDGE